MNIKNHEDYLNAVADAISISEEMSEIAISQYESIGSWLDRDKSSLSKYEPQIYPQGSFLLGTVIKPIGDADEFDIDLVCKLKGSVYDFSMSELKSLIGSELNSYTDAHSFKHEPEDKRRCWTIEYADKANFHMDVLPAIPDQENYKLFLEQKGYAELAGAEHITETAIGITDNELPQYRQKPSDWPSSNPKGYAAWFYERQAEQVNKSRQKIFEERHHTAYASVDDVPQHRVKTPLQKCIQLLKRHRDSTYGKDEDKPISIIITTLSAESYSGEDTLSGTLRCVLTKMDQFIKERGGISWVSNPVNPEENFADKWAEHPIREKVFRKWLDEARRDFGGYFNDAFDKPSGALMNAMTENTFNTVSKSLTLAAPAIATIADKANAEAQYAEKSGETSKPWMKS